MSKTTAKQVKKEKKPTASRKRKKDDVDVAADDVAVKKRKKVVREKVGKEKTVEKAEKDKSGSPDKEEKEHPMETTDDAGSKDEGAKTKGGKKEMPAFSDKNVDYDLFHNSATNVIPRRIKISNNLVITSRMVEQLESKNITNDYPAITFQRKTAGEKCFEFILPLGLVPKIMEAMNIIVKDNSKFFSNSNLL